MNILRRAATFVHASLSGEENQLPLSEPSKSFFIACGSSFELAPDASYRSLIVLSIASVQGLPVASFEKQDAKRLLFLCTGNGKFLHPDNLVTTKLVNSTSCATSLKRPRSWQETKSHGMEGENRIVRAAAMRPIPHTHQMLSFSGASEVGQLNG
ncbi:hypothetical protein QQ045_027860 [Rhodiola kirilowii]